MGIKVVYKTGLQGPAGPQGLPGPGSANIFTWLPEDGFIKIITHNLNTYNLSYSFVDNADGSVFDVGDIVMLSSNVVQFTVTELPSIDGWTILIRE